MHHNMFGLSSVQMGPLIYFVLSLVNVIEGTVEILVVTVVAFIVATVLHFFVVEVLVDFLQQFAFSFPLACR